MPIEVSWQPSFGLAAQGSYQAGLGQYNQRQQELAIKTAMEQARLQLAARGQQQAAAQNAQQMAMRNAQQGIDNQFRWQGMQQQAAQQQFANNFNVAQFGAQNQQWDQQQQARQDWQQAQLDANQQQQQWQMGNEGAKSLEAQAMDFHKELSGIELTEDGEAARREQMGKLNAIQAARSQMSPAQYSQSIGKWLEETRSRDIEGFKKPALTPEDMANKYARDVKDKDGNVIRTDFFAPDGKYLRSVDGPAAPNNGPNGKGGAAASVPDADSFIQSFPDNIKYEEQVQKRLKEMNDARLEEHKLKLAAAGEGAAPEFVAAKREDAERELEDSFNMTKLRRKKKEEQIAASVGDEFREVPMEERAAVRDYYDSLSQEDRKAQDAKFTKFLEDRYGYSVGMYKLQPEKTKRAYTHAYYLNEIQQQSPSFLAVPEGAGPPSAQPIQQAPPQNEDPFNPFGANPQQQAPQQGMDDWMRSGPEPVAAENQQADQFSNVPGFVPASEEERKNGFHGVIAGPEGKPVPVVYGENSKEAIRKLPPGTIFVGDDGRTYITPAR
jgi:hypothetical protein